MRMNNEIRKKPTNMVFPLNLSVQRAVRAPGAPLRPQMMRAVRAAQECAAEITIRIVGEAEGLELNETFRHQNHATNVLSFPYTGTPMVSGDLVLCAAVITREAREQHKSLQAHYMHLIVHGVLHLHGYDHKQKEDAARMEAREIEIMTGFGFANPYSETEHLS